MNIRTNTSSQPKSTVRRRAPRTAAVSITGISENFSYAEALRKARREISLRDLDIERSKIRRSAIGGIIIEIPGPDGKAKADKLRTELTRVLGENAKIQRPEVKGELRIVGMDDSVTKEEVAAAIAKVGGCSQEDIDIGIPRPMRNGLVMAWAKCPLANAVTVARNGKIKVGWTVARVELLPARPLQCYKCWHFGHHQTKCQNPIDRSQLCYRCNKKGHSVNNCKNNLCCALCEEKGINANHKIGSIHCKEFLRETAKVTSSRSTSEVQAEP